MKSLGDIQNEISSSLVRATVLVKSKDKASLSEAKRLRIHISVLREYALYLESNPRESYCVNKLEMLRNRLDLINRQYEKLSGGSKMTSKLLMAHKKHYEKLWEVNKLKIQIKKLEFLVGL